MRKALHSDWPFILLLILLIPFYIRGTQFVPFHPDESTQLYMSKDFKLLLSNPSALFWDPNPEDDPRERYRLLDAPLTRYWIGFVNDLFGNQPLGVDWDWSKSWEENIASGAYPDTKLLQTSRLAITFFLPISLLFIYLISKEIGNSTIAVFAVFFIGTHAVVLLHARRAMAEGAFLMGICFAVWTLLRAHKYPWLAGIGMAIAFNAKQSALALLPAFIIALIWLTGNQKNKTLRAGYNLLVFSITMIMITFALNPIFWNKPLQSIQQACQARAELTAHQVEDTRAIAPEKHRENYPERALVLILNLFISPPEHSLVGNLAPTIYSVNQYTNIPGHNLFRGTIWGGLILVFTIFGFYFAIRNSFRYEGESQRNLLLLLLNTIFMAVGLIISVPLPWIRFTIPLIPLVFLWLPYTSKIFFERRK